MIAQAKLTIMERMHRIYRCMQQEKKGGTNTVSSEKSTTPQEAWECFGKWNDSPVFGKKAVAS